MKGGAHKNSKIVSKMTHCFKVESPIFETSCTIYDMYGNVHKQIDEKQIRGTCRVSDPLQIRNPSIEKGYAQTISESIDIVILKC